MCEAEKTKATVVKTTVRIRKVQNKTKSRASTTSCQSQSSHGPIIFVHSPSTSSSSTSLVAQQQHPGRQRCWRIHLTKRTSHRGNWNETKWEKVLIYIQSNLKDSKFFGTMEIRGMGSSILWGLIVAQDMEANNDSLGIYFDLLDSELLDNKGIFSIRIASMRRF